MSDSAMLMNVAQMYMLLARAEPMSMLKHEAPCNSMHSTPEPSGIKRVDGRPLSASKALIARLAQEAVTGVRFGTGW